jgi:hypothetical protein
LCTLGFQFEFAQRTPVWRGAVSAASAHGAALQGADAALQVNKKRNQAAFMCCYWQCPSTLRPPSPSLWPLLTMFRVKV